MAGIGFYVKNHGGYENWFVYTFFIVPAVSVNLDSFKTLLPEKLNCKKNSLCCENVRRSLFIRFNYC